ncbi:MAG: protein translocase subunit SecF [Candidatus Woesearchaeota archaeon]|nr:protein translocase subunit SecF [Candidatus Woesearchaeota archaeon]
MASKRERREKARLRHLQRQGLASRQEETAEENHESHPGHPDKSHKSKHDFLSRFKAPLKHIYEKEYKKLFIITIVLFILAVAQIGYQVYSTGDFINKGVALKGGVTITVPNVNYDSNELESYLRGVFSGKDISIRTLTGSRGTQSFSISAEITTPEEIAKLESDISSKLNVTKDQYTANYVGSSLGADFFKQTILSLIIAFCAMALVVFIYFRVPIPSLIVIICALADIIETLAVVNLLGIKVSTGGIAAFLMLIGYSVDTDILLTTRLLKRKEETMEESIYSAAKTGLTMTITAIAAVLVALFLSKSAELAQIMTILFIGLVFDILNTWIQNMGILRLYLEIKAAKADKDNSEENERSEEDNA